MVAKKLEKKSGRVQESRVLWFAAINQVVGETDEI